MNPSTSRLNKLKKVLFQRSIGGVMKLSFGLITAVIAYTLIEHNLGIQAQTYEC